MPISDVTRWFQTSAQSSNQQLASLPMGTAYHSPSSPQHVLVSIETKSHYSKNFGLRGGTECSRVRPIDINQLLYNLMFRNTTETCVSGMLVAYHSLYLDAINTIQLVSKKPSDLILGVKELGDTIEH